MLRFERAAGTAARRNGQPSPERVVTVQTMDDVQRLLFRTLEELRNGKLDADMARSIGYLAGVTAKVVETADL